MSQVNNSNDDDEHRAVGYPLQNGGFEISDPYVGDAWIQAAVPRYLDDWR